MTESSRYQKILLLSLGFFLLLVLMAVFHENGILNAYRFEQEQLKMKHENENLRFKNGEEDVTIDLEFHVLEKCGKLEAKIDEAA